LTHRCIPFKIAKAIVNRGFWETLAPPAAYHRHVEVLVEKVDRGFQPTINKLTIPVDKLHELNVGHELHQGREPFIPSSRSRERSHRIKADNGDAKSTRFIHAAICRSRVNVHNVLVVNRQRIQTSRQPPPFIPSDNDDAQRF
jgi:hypothetical protein